MYYKISPLIIIILIVIVACIAIFGAKFLISKNDSLVENEEISNVSEIIPILELSTNTNDENQENVTITAVATTEDENGIYSITLPDGSVSRSDVATYTATENGNYTFKVKGNNGQSSSLTIEVNNIREASANSPYIPSGFSYIGGDVATGYVIEDNLYGNQFVWVPVESGKLTRNTLLDTDYEESNNTATALVNSVAKNYGFYIARFESSSYEINGEIVAASIGGRVPWTNISYTTAATAATRTGIVFGYNGYQTAIINSYAWDTTLAWIDLTNENFSTNTGYGNYSGSIRNTGATESDIKNNVCDLAGNVREWTTEIYKGNSANAASSTSENVTNEIISETINYRVVRGGSANLSRTASSHTGWKENLTDNYWGFRIILYK